MEVDTEYEERKAEGAYVKAFWERGKIGVRLGSIKL